MKTRSPNVQYLAESVIRVNNLSVDYLRHTSHSYDLYLLTVVDQINIYANKSTVNRTLKYSRICTIFNKALKNNYFK